MWIKHLFLPLNTKGAIESLWSKLSKINEDDSTQRFKNGGSFKQRLCEMMRNYKYLYDDPYKGHLDKQRNQLKSICLLNSRHVC